MVGPGIQLFGLFFALIYVALFILMIYLIISTITFFKKKTENDREILKKLDILTKILDKEKTP